MVRSRSGSLIQRPAVAHECTKEGQATVFRCCLPRPSASHAKRNEFTLGSPRDSPLSCPSFQQKTVRFMPSSAPSVAADLTMVLTQRTNSCDASLMWTRLNGREHPRDRAELSITKHGHHRVCDGIRSLGPRVICEPMQGQDGAMTAYPHQGGVPCCNRPNAYVKLPNQ